MRTFSPFTLFTAVFFLVVSFSNLAGAEPKKDEAAKPATTQESKPSSSEEKSNEWKAKESTARDACKKAKDPEKCFTCKMFPEDEICKDTSGDCKSALKDYDEAAADGNKACNAFAKSKSDNTCKNRVDECSKALQGGVENDNTEDSGSSGSSGFGGIATGLLSSFMGSGTQQQSSGGSANQCVRYRTKDMKRDAKSAKEKLAEQVEKAEKEIAETKQKMEEEEKNLNEKLQDIGEKQVEVGEKNAEIKEGLNEKISGLSKDENEKAANLNKQVLDQEKQIEALTKEIFEMKRKADSIVFTHKQAMVSFAKDKINYQCKNAIDQAKSCYLKSLSKTKSKTPSVSADGKDSCAGLTMSGEKGKKGKAELETKLTKVRDACFEQNQLSTEKLNYDKNDNLRSIEKEIEVKNAEIARVKKAMDNSQKEFDDLAKLVAEDKSKAKEVANEKMGQVAAKQAQLSQKAASLQKLANSAQQRLKQSLYGDGQTKGSYANLKELTAKKLLADMGQMDQDELEESYGEAETAINKMEAKREDAKAACCQTNDKGKVTNPKDANCSRVNDGYDIKTGGGFAPTKQTQ